MKFIQTKSELRHIILLAITALSFSCSSQYENIVNSPTAYNIIPQPVDMVMVNGRFEINDNTKILRPSNLSQEADYLADLLSTTVDLNISSALDMEAKGNITLAIDTTISETEGYRLSVKHNAIIITGKTSTGVFYGIQSLRQLMPTAIESAANNLALLTIPAVEIQDHPRFPYRGMHLDVGRHFFKIDKVKKYIDLMAMHKMNSFHWHLTEDQGWRIEIKKYPKLTEIGGYRNGTAIGLAGTKNAPYTYDSIRYGGYYTQEEIKEVVAYATARHIMVIPEIELPGHSLAALAAYPEFGNTGGPHEVAKRWGIFKEVYAPSEETFAFLEDILTEVMALFPSPYIHIGGDEVLKGEWRQSDMAQMIMKREGLKDEHELQSYFIQRIEKFLNKNGKTIIGWDEILEGGLAPNATVMSWRGIEGGIAAAQQQHQVIMTPGTHCYFDLYQAAPEDRIEEPITGSKKHITVEKVYAYEPIPKELSTQEAKFIMGAQGNVWTEYMPTWDRVEYKTLPRLTALSEVVWSPAETKDWDEFSRRLQHIAQRYDELGYNYARYSIKKE